VGSHHVERIAHQVQFAFGHAIRTEDEFGR
jgi:hypothetical protein